MSVNYTLSWAQVLPAAAAALFDPATAATITALPVRLSPAAMNNSLKLSLAPFSLSAGLTYAFSLTIRSNTAVGVALAVVTVPRSTLLAVVMGGNAAVSLSVLAPSVVTLDGSHSVDPDSGDSLSMSFNWTCSRQLWAKHASTITACLHKRSSACQRLGLLRYVLYERTVLV